MGKLKQALGEGIDVTDAQDSFSPPFEPGITDYALYELWSASKTLLENASDLTVGDIQQLTEVMENLHNTIEHVKKPF